MSRWRPVAGFHGRYEVSRLGEVRATGGRTLRQCRNQGGYMLVRLTGPCGLRLLARVHRLVASAFLPNPSSLPVVHHLDNDPGNNCADNLQWCTQADNLAHMTRQGRRASYWAGKRSPNALLSESTAEAIRAAYRRGDGSHAQLAQIFGASKRTVGKIIRGQSYV